MPPQQQQDQGNGSQRSGPNPLVCEHFQGINTATTRAGVPDAQMYWCDGFMPLAPRNLRVLPGIGSAIYNAGSVVWFGFYNIGSTPYMAVFKSDGSVLQIETDNGATTTILPAGTILNPSPVNQGIAQYGSQYLLIASNQPNGYWVWDGTVVYGAGSLAPGVTMTNVGSGYFAPPVVTVNGGNGSGSVLSANINAAGNVTSVTVVNPGTGYLPGDAPTLVFTGGNQAGSGAMLTANLTAAVTGSGATFHINFHLAGSTGGIPVYTISSVNVTNGGASYSSATTIRFSGGAVDFSPASGVPVISGGVITGVTLTNSGTYFNYNLGVTCAAVDTPWWYVSSVSVGAGGTLYGGPNATIAVSGGGAPITTAASMTPTIVTGAVTGATITNPGHYGANTPPSLVVNDTAVTAAGTIQLAPYGIQGNSIETYAGHVWVANGAVVNFTAPGSISDFATSDGGGTFKSSDSFLRVGYTKLIQTNGFLFLVGDSSMNYISGVMVTTSMSVTTTTFTNNNSDPEIGTPYPATVTTLGQDIFLANQNGVYVSAGGTFQKKSEPLDGVWNSAPGVFNGMQLSAAKALIHGKLVWMVLAPIIDPVLKTQRNKLFMFNEKFWWSSEQNVTLTFIAPQEINSVFTAWGTDGISIYPLFHTPTTAFVKTMQTRLWDGPQGFDFTKSSVNLFALAQFLGSANLSYSVYIDNEAGISNRGGPYTHSGATADMEVFSVMPPTTIGQVGVLTGMTLTTTADDLVIVSIMMQDEIVGYRA
jgi:hypothetical protein